jgi:hypothetical protein
VRGALRALRASGGLLIGESGQCFIRDKRDAFATVPLASAASGLLFLTPGILPFALRAGSAVRAAPAAQCHKK